MFAQEETWALGHRSISGGGSATLERPEVSVAVWIKTAEVDTTPGLGWNVPPGGGSDDGFRLAGTDHGRAGTVLVAGRGVVGGRVYGEWPGLAPGQLEDDRDLRVTTDFRRVLDEVTTKRLANPATAEIFPGWQPEPHLGLLRAL